MTEYDAQHHYLVTRITLLELELAKFEQNLGSKVILLDSNSSIVLLQAEQVMLENILLKIDYFRNDPRTFLRITGICRAIVDGMMLSENLPAALASQVVTKLVQYGKIEDEQKNLVEPLRVLLDYLLGMGLGQQDKDFLEIFIKNYNL